MLGTKTPNSATNNMSYVDDRRVSVISHAQQKGLKAYVVRPNAGRSSNP